MSCRTSRSWKVFDPCGSARDCLALLPQRRCVSKSRTWTAALLYEISHARAGLRSLWMSYCTVHTGKVWWVGLDTRAFATQLAEWRSYGTVDIATMLTRLFGWWDLVSYCCHGYRRHFPRHFSRETAGLVVRFLTTVVFDAKCMLESVVEVSLLQVAKLSYLKISFVVT